MSAKFPKPAWFDMGKYFRSRELGFSEWATQIGNRFYLRTLLDASKLSAEHLNAARDPNKTLITELEAKEHARVKLDEFDTKFNLLLVDPFVDLGFNVYYPADQAVHPLSIGVAKAIVTALSKVDCVDMDLCDDKLHEIHPGIFDNQAHLYVDLRAPKPLLRKQFNIWLDQYLIKRSRGEITQKVLYTWARSHPILPYQDLRLWYLRNKGKVPSDEDFAKMRWFIDGANKEAIRQIRDWADRAYTIDTYQDLIQSASLANSPP